MENIFENAKFGDKFKTRDGRMAVYKGYSQNVCFKSANFLIVDKEPIECAFRDNGLYIGNKHEIDIVSRWEEPIDKEKLNQMAKQYHEKIIGRNENAEAWRFDAAFIAGYKAAVNENNTSLSEQKIRDLAQNSCFCEYEFTDVEKEVKDSYRKGFIAGYKIAKEK